MLKPSGCAGCPFERCGDEFVPDKVVAGSKVMFMGQNPGQSEADGQRLVSRRWIGYGQSIDEYEKVEPQPLIGATGQLFDNKYLKLTGLKRQEVSLGNVIRCRPGKSLHMKVNDLPPLTITMKLEESKADIVRAIRHCQERYFRPPDSVELVVAMGRYAQYALTGIQQQEGKGQGVVESWRGYGVDTPSFTQLKTVDVSSYHSLQSNKRVFVTMHPATLFEGRNKRYTHATLSDFTKIRLLLDNKWPLVLPEWSDGMPASWPEYAAFDTEYTVPENELIRWSLCDINYKAYCVEADNTPYKQVPMPAKATVVLQNALADIEHLGRIVGNLYSVRLEDMMLAHATLWTGEPHGLNYIASMFGPINKHKHLDRDQPQLYSALDAYVPMYMWRHHFIPEFKRDVDSWAFYRRFMMPLLKIIAKAERNGVAVNTAKLVEVREVVTDRMQVYQEQARQLTGDDKFRLGSYKSVHKAIYGEENADTE